MARSAQPWSMILGIAGAGIALALAAKMARERRGAGADPVRGPVGAVRGGTAARRVGEGDIRSAGPEGMRRETGRKWTPVDEASDESFPASDPPSTY